LIDKTSYDHFSSRKFKLVAALSIYPFKNALPIHTKVNQEHAVHVIILIIYLVHHIIYIIIKVASGIAAAADTRCLQAICNRTAEVCMDWILDFSDPDSGCILQDPDSSFLHKNRIRAGFCNLLMKSGL